MSGEKLNKVELEHEMKDSYIDYAMSVIISRALPDARDGLKPVHRRILYAMDNLGLNPSSPFKKSATIVGDVIGKYHPHGDASVYDAIVRMAQDFNLRYPLIQGQGNFGSIDGDPAAAYRYTEARMTKAAMDMLCDLDKDTIDFDDNFDASLKEPSVLPSKLPNILINGSSGIAVGMATNIPPHNASEIAEAALILTDNPDADDEEIMRAVKGPDFPGGGIIMGDAGIRKAYLTGKGIITIRARIETEKLKRREAIVVTEIPYQVNKSKLVEQIADGIKKGKITNVSDLRDESDKSGVRIVIELSQGARTSVVKNQLFKHSNLQISYGIIMLALMNGEPKLLTLKETLSAWLDHRKEVVRRRTAFLLRKGTDRAEILEALLKAIDDIDRIIKIIRTSKKRADAEANLMAGLDITKRQAGAILDMRLESLIGLEKGKLDKEYLKLIKDIAVLEDTLNNPKRLLSIIKREIREVMREYGDDRQTEINMEAAQNPEIEDLIPEEPVMICLMKNGFIKRTPVPKKSDMAQDPEVDMKIEATTHHKLVMLTNQGKIYAVMMHEIAETGRASRGTAAINIAALSPDERPIVIAVTRDFSESVSIFSLSSRGYAKRTDMRLFSAAKKSGLTFMKLDDGDEVIMARILGEGEKEEFITVSELGSAFLCKTGDLEFSGKSSKGKRINAKQEGDRIACIAPNPPPGKELAAITANGAMCRISMNQFRLPSKANQTIQLMKADEANPVRLAFTASKDETVEITLKSGRRVKIITRDIDTASKSRKGRIPGEIGLGEEVESVSTGSPETGL